MELHERIAARPTARRRTLNGNGNDPFAELKNRIHLALVSELGPRLFDVDDSDAVRERVESEIGDQLAPGGGAVARRPASGSPAEIADDIFGYGPLERLLSDPTISEIMVNGPHDIWIERARPALADDADASRDASHLRRIITKMVGQIGRRIDESSPLVDARLPDGSRVNAIIPPLSLSGPLLTIRKFATEPLRHRRSWSQIGTLSEDAAEFLEQLHRGAAEHPHLGRNRLGQDDVPERALGGDPRQRPDRHDRGRGRAPARPAARAPARVAPEEHRGRGRDHDPRSRPQRAAHASRPDHRRRGSRRGGARHAPGDEHGPRGLALDRARELAPRRAQPPRDDGADGRLRAAAPRDPAARLVGARPRSSSSTGSTTAHAGVRRDLRGAADGGRGDHAPEAVRVQDRPLRRRPQDRRRLQPTGLRPGFLGKFERHGIELPLEPLRRHRERDLRRRRRAGSRDAAATDEALARAARRLPSAASLVAAAGAAAAAPATVEIAPGHAAAVPRARLRRQRPRRAALDARSVEVRENGGRVTGVRVDARGARADSASASSSRSTRARA